MEKISKQSYERVEEEKRLIVLKKLILDGVRESLLSIEKFGSFLRTTKCHSKNKMIKLSSHFARKIGSLLLFM